MTIANKDNIDRYIFSFDHNKSILLEFKALISDFDNYSSTETSNSEVYRLTFNGSTKLRTLLRLKFHDNRWPL
jgi:hypothetical protein